MINIMYKTLIFRSLSRHKKKGRRLFVLMALCSATIILLLSFKEDFKRQSEEQLVQLRYGHLEIVPPDSPLAQKNLITPPTENLSFINFDKDFDIWLRSLPEVAEASPSITRYGIAYSLGGETESWLALLAVDAKRLASLLPLTKALEGSDDISWTEGEDVPILRATPYSIFGSYTENPDIFYRYQLRANDEGLPQFFSEISKDFPKIFISPPYQNAADDWNRFLTEWNAFLIKEDVHEWLDEIPDYFFEDYDWKLDDALWELRENTNFKRKPFLKKKVFQALYPNDIVDLWEPVYVGKQVTLQLPLINATEVIALPVAVNAVYTGFCAVDPLYQEVSFMDINAFRYYMGLKENEATEYIVRLHKSSDVEKIKAVIEDKLLEMGSDAKVVDWKHLGEMQMTTATAFTFVIGLLIGLFIIIVLIFTVNLVLISLLQRKKEIGTGLAMGLSTDQTTLLMSAEVGLIAFVSCLLGSVFALVLVALFSKIGIPGMVFFVSGKLFLQFRFYPFIMAFLILVPSTMLVSFIPLSQLNEKMPVDFFKEGK